MKAMLSTAPGGPETLTETDLPSPDCGPDQIVVAVEAAGVNFPDTLIIRDLYQFKPPRPFAPGGEIAGRVIKVGAEVEGFDVGDRVAAMIGFGGFATEVAVPVKAAMKIEDDMPATEAASIVLTYGTSYHSLKDRAALEPGETVLILGAAGGVGSAAIELAKAMGARVIAAVSSEDKAAFCRNLGADETLIYAREMDREGQKAFSAQIKAAAGGGVDVVYDAVGGDFAEPALRALNWKGRYLVVGFPAGIPKIPLNLALLKGTDICGVFWGAHTEKEPALHAQNMADLMRFYAEGKIKPQVTATFPLADAGAAMEMMEQRKALGKIVVTMPASAP